MKVGFFPGSFDPFINGHLSVIKRTANDFDKVIVAIMTNPLKMKKGRRFSKTVMKRQIEKVLERENLYQIEVIISNDFFLNIALKYDASVIIRGIRKSKERKYESLFEHFLAFIYKVTLGLNTIFVYDENSLSSTVIMEMMKNGKSVEDLVPPEILEVIKPM